MGITPKITLQPIVRAGPAKRKPARPYLVTNSNDEFNVHIGSLHQIVHGSGPASSADCGATRPPLDMI